jgi:site-specific DNA-methyltransferase (adenine-specific)
MRPYFRTKLGKLYQSDSIELLRTLETGSARLVVADPPYGIGKAEWDTFKDRCVYVEWALSWIREAARVLDDRGTLYIMGFPEILADVKFLASEHFEGCRWLVWYYRNKANLGRNWGRSHEAVLCFRKTRRAVFNVDAVRIPYNAHTLRYPARPQAESSNFSRPGGKHRNQVWTPHPLGAKPKDVLEIPTLCNGTAEKTSHPTQKPLDLIRRFVLASSNPGDLVIDPFAGSGTTLVACEESGRPWIGVDSDRSSCEIARKRMSDPNAFVGEQTLEARRSAVTRRRARLRHRSDNDLHEHVE